MIDISNPTERLKLYGGGRVAGRTFAFCRAMDWSMRPYQKIFLARLLYHKELKAFIPARRFDYAEHWLQAHPKKEWHVMIIEEAAFLPNPLP